MDSNTLSQKINELQQQGYTENFSVKNDKILNIKDNKEIQIDELQIDHFYRFEGMTNPSDLSILYAVETNDGKKGTLVDGYGISSEISKELSKRIQK